MLAFIFPQRNRQRNTLTKAYQCRRRTILNFTEINKLRLLQDTRDQCSLRRNGAGSNMMPSSSLTLLVPVLVLLSTASALRLKLSGPSPSQILARGRAGPISAADRQDLLDFTDNFLLTNLSVGTPGEHLLCTEQRGASAGVPGAAPARLGAALAGGP